MSGRWTDVARPARPAWPSSPGRPPRRPSAGLQQATIDGVDDGSCSYVLPLRWRAAAPENFGLDGELVAVIRRIPRFGQLLFDRFHAPFDQRLVLRVGDIGQSQHRRRFTQFIK